MNGIIGIEHLRIRCIIGINPEEREFEQDIFVDLKVESDISRCITSDSIRDTINYIALKDLCIRLAHSKRHRLMETFAGDILIHLFKEFDIQWAWIRVKKPNAISEAEYAMIELQLTRAKFELSHFPKSEILQECGLEQRK